MGDHPPDLRRGIPDSVRAFPWMKVLQAEAHQLLENLLDPEAWVGRVFAECDSCLIALLLIRDL